MKRFFNLMSILLFAITLFSSCTSTKIEISKVNKNDFPDNPVSYVGYWTAMRCAMPELIDTNTNLLDDQVKFAKVVKFLKYNEIDSVEAILRNILNTTQNDTIKYYSTLILDQTMAAQSKWTELLDYHKNDTLPDDEISQKLLYPIYSKAEKEKYSYLDIADTIKINFKSGLCFVPVEVNGKKYEFVFDTGSQLSLVSEEVAKECNIVPLTDYKSTLVGSTGIETKSTASVINQLTIGNSTIHNNPCQILPDNSLRFKWFIFTLLKIDGIIGWNAIKNFNVEIDYKNEHIILKKPHKIKNSTNSMFWAYHPIIKAKSENGTDLLFLLDTGSDNTYLYDFAIRKLKPEILKEKSISKYGIGGSEKSKYNIVKQLNLYIDGVSLAFENIESRDDDKDNDNFFVLDGVIGSDLAKKAIIKLDYTNGKFELVPFGSK